MQSKTRLPISPPEGPRTAQSELRQHLDALRGGEDYLRTLVLQAQARPGRTGYLKDSGARRELSIKATDNVAALLQRASVLEGQLGLGSGTLSRPVAVFQERFVEFVDSWSLHRPDAKFWAQSYPLLWALLNEATGRVQIDAFEDGFHRRESYNDVPEASERNAELAAARLFLDLVSHPLNERLRRCRRCQEFFVAGRSDQLACSLRCATALTARAANARRRKRDRVRQLARLRRAIEAISGTDMPPDWKTKAAQLARLTPTFVSRALNRGEIKTPRTR